MQNISKTANKLVMKNFQILLVLILMVIIFIAGTVSMKVTKVTKNSQVQINELQKENEDLNKELINLTKEKETYKDSIEKLISENSLLKEDIEKNKINYESLNKKLDSLINLLKQ